MAEEQVITPGGARPKSLVYQIEPGHTLRMAGDRVQKFHPNGTMVADLGAIAPRPGPLPLMPRNVVVPEATGPALGSGWITYAGWSTTADNQSHPSEPLGLYRRHRARTPDS
jgi:hypothetical protein